MPEESRRAKRLFYFMDGIIENVFQMEGKECKDQERLKMCREKSMQELGRCFSME